MNILGAGLLIQLGGVGVLGLGFAYDAVRGFDSRGFRVVSRLAVGFSLVGFALVLAGSAAVLS